jgi:hypothetical protein
MSGWAQVQQALLIADRCGEWLRSRSCRYERPIVQRDTLGPASMGGGARLEVAAAEVPAAEVPTEVAGVTGIAALGGAAVAVFAAVL